MSSSKPLNASISLSVDDKTRHWFYFRQTPRTAAEKRAHETDMGGASVTKTVQVHNGRTNQKSLTLDDASFELVECPTKLSTQDFYEFDSQPEKQEQYYQEVADLLKKKLGCDEVKVMHHQVRNEAAMGSSKANVAGYALGGPHTDSSHISGDETALLMMPDDETKYKRYLYVNLWRSIDEEHPIQDHHLAMLDERTTVKPDDYLVRDLFGDGYSTVQYGLNARHAQVHKWYYYPKMTMKEGILFKQMDSDWTKSGRVCFHMAIQDETAPKDAPPRQSIEVRCLCYWKEADVDSMPTKENIHADLIQEPLERAIQQSQRAVETASIFQLLYALLRKVPLVGTLVGLLFGTGPSTPAAKYSGKPEDYLTQFVNAINYFPAWPSFGKTWAEGEMKKAPSVNEGIAVITRALVQDTMGYQKTKHFKQQEKKAISTYLLSNEAYMAVAKKHLGQFGKE